MVHKVAEFCAIMVTVLSAEFCLIPSDVCYPPPKVVERWLVWLPRLNIAVGGNWEWNAVCGGHIIFILLFLEPQWPLFLKVNHSKQGLFHSKQGSFGFQIHLMFIYQFSFLFYQLQYVCLSWLGNFQATGHVDCPPCCSFSFRML